MGIDSCTVLLSWRDDRVCISDRLAGKNHSMSEKSDQTMPGKKVSK